MHIFHCDRYFLSCTPFFQIIAWIELVSVKCRNAVNVGWDHAVTKQSMMFHLHMSYINGRFRYLQDTILCRSSVSDTLETSTAGDVARNRFSDLKLFFSCRMVEGSKSEMR